jgi:hypothetical protein
MIDRATWNRVQALLGGHVYHATTLTYAGQFMTCGHCGHPITGELVRKKRKDGGVTADYATKRRLLEIVFLNSRLDGVTLCPTMRKPFDVLAEGLISEKSRGDRIRTYDPLVPNQMR